MKIKKENKEKMLDASIIGTHPFAMKELILRGYRVLAISPDALDMQVNAVQKREIIIERRFRN